MKNLEEYGVTELNQNEANASNGGFGILFILGMELLIEASRPEPHYRAQMATYTTER